MLSRERLFGLSAIDENVSNVMEEPNNVLVLNMGWALKKNAANRRRFTDKQKQYLVDLFILGEHTGQ